MSDTQHFCLRWNNYQSSITSAFENLRDDEDFVDVTLACEGRSLKAHRVVLSACSPYFRELLKSTPCKHPVIVLQDVSFADLFALVEFIYHGEVNVHQRSLSSFLKTAEVLRVSGLTQRQAEETEALNHAQNLSSSSTPPINYHHQLSASFGHQDNNSYPAPAGTPDSPLPLNANASDKSSSISNSIGNGGNGIGNNSTGNGPTQRPEGKMPSGATVNQLLRRAAAAAAIEAQRRDRRNSTDQHSDCDFPPSNNKRPRGPHLTPPPNTNSVLSAANSLNLNNNNTIIDPGCRLPQLLAADYSSTAVKQHQLLLNNHHHHNKETQDNGGLLNNNGLNNDRDSSTSPIQRNASDSDVIKSEPQSGSTPDDHSDRRTASGDSPEPNDLHRSGLHNMHHSGPGGMNLHGGYVDDGDASPVDRHHAGVLANLMGEKLFGPFGFGFGTADHSAMAGLGSPSLQSDLAGTSQGFGLRQLSSNEYHQTAAGKYHKQETPKDNSIIRTSIGTFVQSSSPHHQKPSENFRCEPCNKKLTSLTRLKRHIQNVHMRPSKEPICNICKRVYSSLNSLRNHKSIYHRMVRPKEESLLNDAGPGYGAYGDFAGPDNKQLN